MKQSIKILLLFLLPAMGWGQGLITIGKDKETGKYSTAQVVQVDSLKAGLMFSRAMEWVALNYKSAKDVIQYSDQATGKIICKGNFPVDIYMKKGWIEHTMVLEFKDGRYRFSFSDFVYYSNGSGRVPFEGGMVGRGKAIEAAEENISAHMTNLTAYLKKGGSSGGW